MPSLADLPQNPPSGNLAQIQAGFSPVSDVLSQAIQKYPYLADKNLSYTRSPDTASEGRLLEYWKPGDKGWDWKGKHFERPKNLPEDSHGIEIFSDQVSPIDILGDYVSHHAVDNDPKLKELYTQFINATPPQQMRERYDYHQKNLGEKRPYMDWLQSSGLPELFRGHTFNQWGQDSAKYYNPEQLKILNNVRQYLGIQ